LKVLLAFLVSEIEKVYLADVGYLRLLPIMPFFRVVPVDQSSQAERQIRGALLGAQIRSRPTGPLASTLPDRQ